MLIKNSSIPQKATSILLCNNAHLGDVVMTTALLTALKKRYPQVKIGLLVGSWSKPLLENHPYIDRIHTIDHWKVNRSSSSLYKKYSLYRRSFKKALQEIISFSYDMAIDLNYNFPSSAFLLYRARIPYRIGYTSAGLAALYTDREPWRYTPQSTVHYGAALFEKTLPLDRKDLRTHLTSSISFKNLSPTFNITSKGYTVVHIGSGNAIKDWPLTHWEELLKRLCNQKLILTGKGKKDAKQIAMLCHKIPFLINACDLLSLPELICLIKHAKLLLSVDTAAGHIAAAVDTPAVLIYTGIHPLQQWSPYGKNLHVLSEKVPCYPCFRPKGCNTMRCLRDVTPEHVYQTLQQFQ